MHDKIVVFGGGDRSVERVLRQHAPERRRRERIEGVRGQHAVGPWLTIDGLSLAVRGGMLSYTVRLGVLVWLVSSVGCTGESTDPGGVVDGGVGVDGWVPSDRDGGAISNSDGGCAGDLCIPPEEQDCMPEELTGDSFCDGATWGGAAPTASTEVVIASGQTVIVDCEATAGRIEIEPGGILRASREVSSTLTVHGNLVVRGVLDYGRPGCRVPAGTTAEIIFTGMTDDAYAGTPDAVAPGSDRGPSADTPMAVVEGDTGLWIVDDGALSAAGVPKRSWSRLVEAAGPGDPVFQVEDATGWERGDRVVLTPTAMRSERGHAEQFDEGIIASVNGNEVTLEAAPAHAHAGCADGCTRRGEGANLTRNVVIRSADDEAHAHIMVAQQGHVGIDSVELRWLGPEQCGGPERRAPLWFHQQDDASRESFVRHAAIWGGDKHGLMVERSHGIEIVDVVGYDSYSTAFALFYDSSACGTRCTDREVAPRDVVFRGVMAAKIGVGQRDGCDRISHRMAGLVVSGGEGSGAEDSVATGIGYVGNGADVAGFTWSEGGSGRPLDFYFNRNVAHNNGNHGAFIWHNGGNSQAPYQDNAFWSNDDYGIKWGAYNNAFVLQRFVATDNGRASVGIKAVPSDDRARLDGATIDSIEILAYVLVQGRANILRDLTFEGASPLGVTQLHETCDEGDPNDPDDPDCTRIWLRFENPRFASGVVPFDFGWTFNFHSIWEVRGFEHADAEYDDLPADFDLHRADNEVAGGHYDARFDAWLVPR